ncbi:MAG: peptidoglycan-binding protein [Candidatus Sericytochromatia bacterium]|nr:peptidoglycan-binding protein [Candidatus Sericytochromatia bacterium]
MTTVPTRPTAPTPAPVRTGAMLLHGSRGEGVRELQAALKALGFNAGDVDGVFGERTGMALRDFQVSHALPADGVAGPQTLKLLNAKLAARQKEETSIDTRSTWSGVTGNVYMNFGHRLVDDSFVHLSRDKRLVWSDTGTLVSPHQWAAIGNFQREHFLKQVPVAEREAVIKSLMGGSAAKIKREAPPTPAVGRNQPPMPGSSADQQMKNMLEVAKRHSVGKRPDGWCYMHVWNYIERSGYGNMPGEGIPDSHATYAKQFAEYADANLARLGLRKLALDNPYKAPPGAIVVVRPGTPGTAHPIAGDIAIATGQGWFANGGEMGYGGPGNFPPGNKLVLGIYVPA